MEVYFPFYKDGEIKLSSSRQPTSRTIIKLSPTNKHFKAEVVYSYKDLCYPMKEIYASSYNAALRRATYEVARRIYAITTLKHINLNTLIENPSLTKSSSSPPIYHLQGPPKSA